MLWKICRTWGRSGFHKVPTPHIQRHAGETKHILGAIKGLSWQEEARAGASLTGWGNLMKGGKAA